MWWVGVNNEKIGESNSGNYNMAFALFAQRKQRQLSTSSERRRTYRKKHSERERKAYSLKVKPKKNELKDEEKGLEEQQKQFQCLLFIILFWFCLFLFCFVLFVLFFCFFCFQRSRIIDKIVCVMNDQTQKKVQQKIQTLTFLISFLFCCSSPSLCLSCW